MIGGVDHDRYEGELHYTPLKVRSGLLLFLSDLLKGLVVCVWEGGYMKSGLLLSDLLNEVRWYMKSGRSIPDYLLPTDSVSTKPGSQTITINPIDRSPSMPPLHSWTNKNHRHH